MLFSENRKTIRCRRMARRPAAFRQQDVARALRAARSVGLEVIGYEIDTATGKIVVNTSALSRSEQSPGRRIEKMAGAAPCALT
jgi:hypothetical protein